MCIKITWNLTKLTNIIHEFRNIMSMKDRFWSRLGKPCSLLVAIWIRFIKLFNRSKILKAVDIETSEEDLTPLLEEEHWK